MGGHADGGIDSCQSDSGGPMTLNIDDTEYVMGVVSWGVGCGRPELPGVYAKVSAQLDWIRSLESMAIRGRTCAQLAPEFFVYLAEGINSSADNKLLGLRNTYRKEFVINSWNNSMTECSI